MTIFRAFFSELSNLFFLKRTYQSRAIKVVWISQKMLEELYDLFFTYKWHQQGLWFFKFFSRMFDESPTRIVRSFLVSCTESLGKIVWFFFKSILWLFSARPYQNRAIFFFLCLRKWRDPPRQKYLTFFWWFHRNHVNFLMHITRPAESCAFFWGGEEEEAIRIVRSDSLIRDRQIFLTCRFFSPFLGILSLNYFNPKIVSYCKRLLTGPLSTSPRPLFGEGGIIWQSPFKVHS